MTTRAVIRRSRRWTRRSERAIPYGPFARFSDWWCASRDARKGVPVLPPQDRATGDPTVPLSTPRMMFLGQLTLERIEKEWIVYQAGIADIEPVLRDHSVRCESLARDIEAARARLTRLQEAPPELNARVAGEERTDPAIVRQRRTLELNQRRDREVTTAQALTSQLHAAEAQIAQLEQRIQIRLRIAQRRAAMIEAHSMRRRAAYLTRLVRRHPEGARLNRLLRPDWPELPAWTRRQPAAEPIAAAAVDNSGVPGAKGR